MPFKSRNEHDGATVEIESRDPESKVLLCYEGASAEHDTPYVQPRQLKFFLALFNFFRATLSEDGECVICPFLVVLFGTTRSNVFCFCRNLWISTTRRIAYSPRWLTIARREWNSDFGRERWLCLTTEECYTVERRSVSAKVRGIFRYKKRKNVYPINQSINQSINRLDMNVKNASSSGMLREYRRIQVSSAGGLPAKWSFHECSSRCQSELLSAKVQRCRFWSVSWRNWVLQHVDFAQVDLLIAWRGRNCKENRISSL